MSEIGRTRNGSRKRRRLFLFCAHALARDHFARQLRSSEFVIVPSIEFHLPEMGEHGDGGSCLAVVDAGLLPEALELIRGIRRQGGQVELMALLPALTDASAFPLLRLGVKGLLSYEQCDSELSRAATQVVKGGYWVPREVLMRFVQAVLPELQEHKSLDSEAAELSRREREVLDLLLDNLSNKEIAARLFVSERTVKFHVSNLLSKFGVQRRADLIVLWLQRSAAPLPVLPREMGKTLSSRVN
jgi:DNA-binding NarL/FixJ family response regulator